MGNKRSIKFMLCKPITKDLAKNMTKIPLEIIFALIIKEENI